jgi:hypothetical protein
VKRLELGQVGAFIFILNYVFKIPRKDIHVVLISLPSSAWLSMNSRKWYVLSPGTCGREAAGACGVERVKGVFFLLVSHH